MRALLPVTIAVVLAVPSPARAQSPTASGALGAGVFDDRPATSLDVGVDLAGADYALGLGARVWWLSGDGLRGEDWDQAGDLARIVRYLTYRRGPEGRSMTLALGELGGVVLGSGAIFDGYASGIDVDHRHLGAELRVERDAVTAEALVDDVVAPRIAALRAGWTLRPDGRDVQLGATVAGDRGVGSLRMDATGAIERDRTMVALFGADASIGVRSADEQMRGALYAEGVGVTAGGLGLHLGARGELLFGSETVRIGGRAELRAGTDGYVPGWFGPLYEAQRPTRLDTAESGGLGGLGALAGITADAAGYGHGELSWSHRAGLPGLLRARLAAPYFQRVQAALWTAIEIGDAEPDAAFAMEVRARLPEHLFVAMEATRLYRDDDGVLAPAWIAAASVGAVLGE